MPMNLEALLRSYERLGLTGEIRIKIHKGGVSKIRQEIETTPDDTPLPGASESGKNPNQ